MTDHQFISCSDDSTVHDIVVGKVVTEFTEGLTTGLATDLRPLHQLDAAGKIREVSPLQLLSVQQYHYLSPAAVKLLGAIYHENSWQFVTTYQRLMLRSGIRSRTTIDKVLDELESHSLIERDDKPSRNSKHQINGITLRVCVPPEHLPQKAYKTQQIKLERKATKLARAQAEMEREIKRLGQAIDPEINFLTEAEPYEPETNE